MKQLSWTHKYLKTGLFLLGALTLTILLIPVLAALGWTVRGLVIMLIPVAFLVFLVSPRFRQWLGIEDSEWSPYFGVKLSKDVMLSRNHSWGRFGLRRSMTVGVDDLVQQALGPVESAVLPEPGESRIQGEPLFKLQGANRNLVVRAPISGAVTSVNRNLLTKPDLLNSSPYRAGWAVRMRPDEPGEVRTAMLTPDMTEPWLRAQVDELIWAISPPLQQSLTGYDGGTLVQDLHRVIDDATWQEIRVHFFGDGPTRRQ